MAPRKPRNRLALREPDETTLDFARFPRKTFRVGTDWYRQHTDRPTADRGAWWYASVAADGVDAGRFDLPHPYGTCYLATTAEAAVNELIGPDASERGWVDADLISGRVLSKLKLPAEVKAADTTSARASRFRVTNELATTEQYDLTQAWAATLHRSGFDGVHATLRFTPGVSRGLALFGDRGAPATPLPGDPSPRPVRAVVQKLGVEVVGPPPFASVAIVQP